MGKFEYKKSRLEDFWFRIIFASIISLVFYFMELISGAPILGLWISMCVIFILFELKDGGLLIE